MGCLLTTISPALIICNTSAIIISKGLGILKNLRHILPGALWLLCTISLLSLSLPIVGLFGVVQIPLESSLFLFYRKEPLAINSCNMITFIHTAPLFNSINILTIHDLNRYCVSPFVFNWIHDAFPSIFRDNFHHLNDIPILIPKSYPLSIIHEVL